MTVRYLQYEQVVRLHHELMLEEGKVAPVISPEKLEAAVLRPQATAFGEDAYPSLADKAAALLESIAIGHPFLDGNKRAAFVAMDTFLRLNGVRRDVVEDGMYDLVVAVAAGDLSGNEAIAERLRELYAPDLDGR
ncbi:MAG: type II toxin-antitoxin system death-on-curing family toxin [Dehalococcoidia bacterium]|nr:type II toxin-antitoxin system death-on-curing family toxin [Dehalococcoidia bacterium]